MTGPRTHGRRPVLLIGRNGQIGWELHRLLQPLGVVVAPDRSTLDLTNADSIRRTVRETLPWLVVNAAAYTNVDAAEDNEEEATAVNGTAPGILAEECLRTGASLIHYSTDYIFDGRDPEAAGQPARRAYVETDPPRPLNAYGRSKLVGEESIQSVGGTYLILRTSWVYSRRGRNFLLAIQRLAREREELRIVNDQCGSPTWARMIAAATAAIIARGWPALNETRGIYHLSAAGEASWFDFAEAILAHQNKAHDSPGPRLAAITTEAYPTPAIRPAYSVLDNKAIAETFDIRLPDWRRQLELCLGP